jgi:hypothetical protein
VESTFLVLLVASLVLLAGLAAYAALKLTR